MATLKHEVLHLSSLFSSGSSDIFGVVPSLVLLLAAVVAVAAGAAVFGAEGHLLHRLDVASLESKKTRCLEGNFIRGVLIKHL